MYKDTFERALIYANLYMFHTYVYVVPLPKLLKALSEFNEVALNLHCADKENYEKK